MTGAVFSLDGTECLKETVTGTLPDPSVQDGSCPHAILTQSSIYVPTGMRDITVTAEKLGGTLAQALIARGAEEVLRKAREGKDLVQQWQNGAQIDDFFLKIRMNVVILATAHPPLP